MGLQLGNQSGQIGVVRHHLCELLRVAKGGLSVTCFTAHREQRTEDVEIVGVSLVRATQQGQQAGIVAVEAPIHRSNVMVIDPETKQPTRVRIVEKEEARDGKVKTVRVRVAKKSGKELA